MFDFNTFPKASEAHGSAIKNVELSHLAELEATIMEAQELLENAMLHGKFYFTMRHLSANAIDFLSSNGYRIKSDGELFTVSF